MNDPVEARRKRTLALAVPLGVITVGGFVGATFMPYLLATMPLVLIALSPLFRHIVMVTPSVDPVWLYAVAVPRHFLPDPLVYLIGRDYGPLAVDWLQANSPTMGRFVRFVERLVARYGVVALLVSPDLIVSTLAGAARMPFARFVVWNVLGTFVTVTAARLLGNALQDLIASMVVYIRTHLFQVTIGFALVMVLINWLSNRKRPGAAPETPAEP